MREKAIGYRVEFSLWRLLFLYIGFELIFDLRKSYELSWWEPINVLNHAGNFEGFAITYFITLLIGLMVINRIDFSRREVLFWLFIVGFIVGLAVNIINETAWGQSLTGFANVRDIWDVVYGVAASVLTSLFGLKIKSSVNAKI